MAWAKHRKLQHDQDFKALRNYEKTLPADLLDTINGAGSQCFFVGKAQKGGQLHEQKVRQEEEPHVG